MKKINLYHTYRKVKQRVKRSSGLQTQLANCATAAAILILENPSLKAVEFFRKIERKWLLTTNKKSVAIADEFEKAIRSKNYEIVKAYSSYETDWRPKSGYLYCFSSADYPRIVKIGATEASIERRLKEYKARYSLNHLKVVMSAATKDPAFKEKKIHSILHDKKVYPKTIKKSNEWFRVSQKLAKELIIKYA